MFKLILKNSTITWGGASHYHHRLLRSRRCVIGGSVECAMQSADIAAQSPDAQIGRQRTTGTLVEDFAEQEQARCQEIFLF